VSVVRKGLEGRGESCESQEEELLVKRKKEKGKGQSLKGGDRVAAGNYGEDEGGYFAKKL